ncbi:trypsin-like peptidase domain-containing protein [Saccharothrix obliqua]|uniref:trypsin-like peptidase domain-containing protein n=1 Tax=Saccharothrix obliqua TaxID=2861747 RepID=UPI001C5D4449|nr:trypsin-like peptidase domain-containing protein [Saccharothrix obliqua]MBW4720334.1 serine protease [Saccharothrix obliqua]
MSRRIGVLSGVLLVLAVAAPAARAAAIDFAGAVDVNGCSGSLVRMPGSRDDDRALVLTNGHCYDGPWPVPDEVLVDQPADRAFDLLDGAGEPIAALTATKALYVTMTGTDIALYQVASTYRELAREHGVRPRTVSAERPARGADIRVVSGSLRQIFSCRVDHVAYRVLEAGYVTKDVLRYGPACNTGPGTSGSPVVDAGSGDVVAINNTSNRDGGQCTENNPCEMDRYGVITVHKGIGYGTQTHWLTTCVAGHRLDLDRRGCLLPRPDPRI